jgi:hypothetical protein
LHSWAKPPTWYSLDAHRSQSDALGSEPPQPPPGRDERPLSAPTAAATTDGAASAAADAVGPAYALPGSAVASATAAINGAWSFEDTEVAARFDREALCHIPDYACVVEASVDAVEKALAALLHAADEAAAASPGSGSSGGGGSVAAAATAAALGPVLLTPEQAAAADVHYSDAHALR